MKQKLAEIRRWTLAGKTLQSREWQCNTINNCNFYYWKSSNCQSCLTKAPSSFRLCHFNLKSIEIVCTKRNHSLIDLDFRARSVCRCTKKPIICVLDRRLHAFHVRSIVTRCSRSISRATVRNGRLRSIENNMHSNGNVKKMRYFKCLGGNGNWLSIVMQHDGIETI